MQSPCQAGRPGRRAVRSRAPQTTDAEAVHPRVARERLVCPGGTRYRASTFTLTSRVVGAPAPSGVPVTFTIPSPVGASLSASMVRLTSVGFGSPAETLVLSRVAFTPFVSSDTLSDTA